MKLRTALLTVAALTGFAANSLLCRLALAERHIDAATFTGVRLASGALVLALLAFGRPGARTPGTWPAAFALFLYAAPFSYAYLRLNAGTGALVLFAAVQATMIGWGIGSGERPRMTVWAGLLIALIGMAGLTAPGATAPDPVGAALMALAGAAWGAYSLAGRAAQGDPLRTTAGNFIRSVPLALLLVAASAATAGVRASPRGLVLAVLSGAFASGLGYSIWYAALKRLTATRAAVLQLLVPVLVAAGGVVLLGERVSLRQMAAGAAILGGVALAINARPGSVRK